MREELRSYYERELSFIRQLGGEFAAKYPTAQLHVEYMRPDRIYDALREDASGTGKIGTTRRGIGPAYEDKVGRRAIRVCDLAQLDDLGPLLDRLCAHHDALRAGFGEPRLDQRRFNRVAPARQAFMETVQAPDILGMLARPVERAVEADGAVDVVEVVDAAPPWFGVTSAPSGKRRPRDCSSPRSSATG